MKIKLIPYLLLVVVVSCNKPTDTIEPENHAMVSSAHPLATQAGLDILEKGGNAFDAAVAIAATLNVVEPMMSGMGGYGTILVYDAEKKKIRYLDSSGKIPINTNADLMRAPTPNFMKNRFGPKAVSTPGNVNAWWAMSSEYGKLNWGDLFSSAIKHAEEGFEVSERLGYFIKSSFDQMSSYTKEFYGRDGAYLVPGDLLVQKDLAVTFDKLSKQGPEVFYQGELARAIDKSMSDKEGFLSYQDLKDDKAEWWEPIKIDYDDYEIYTASPPANAFPSLIRLGMMRSFQGLDHNSTEYLHAYSEVTKHAFWSRLKYAGDPEITPPPLEMLLSDEYLAEQANNISTTSAKDFEPPLLTNEGKNTTHFVVADKWGNIVSATQTLGNIFGSKIMPEGTGIWLNNSLAYCTYEPKGNPMDAIPGQRKLSGDCPTIIMKDGRPWAALGTPGGHTIAQNVPQIILNMLEFDMGIQQAISEAKITFVEPNSIHVEEGVSEEVFQALSNLGHKVKRTSRIGNAHGLTIQYDNEGKIIAYKGGADPRGEGVAKGY